MGFLPTMYGAKSGKPAPARERRMLFAARADAALEFVLVSR
jgi:hypothetical protein